MMVKNRDRLISHGNVDGRRIVLDILEAGFEVSDPYENAKKLIRVENDKLMFGHPDFEWQTSDKRSKGRAPSGIRPLGNP